jgi:hypothetical protein
LHFKPHQIAKMKRALLFVALVALISSCNFTQSVNFDLTTGISTRGNGLSSEDVFLEIKGERVSRNEFIYGEEVFVNFSNVGGFTKEGGAVFPGMSIYIVQGGTDTVLGKGDLLTDLNEGTSTNPLLLRSNFTVAVPHSNNEQYRVLIRYWDKKGNGEFTFEMPFTVVPNKLLNVEANDVTYSEIYLWNQRTGKVVADKQVSKEDGVLLMFEGVEGFTEYDGLVYPALAIKCVDADNNVVLSLENTLDEYAESGAAAALLAQQVPLTLSFESLIVRNPVQLTATLYDLKSDRQIVVTTEVEIN